MKRNLLKLALCALTSLTLISCGEAKDPSSSQQEEVFGAAKNFTVDAATGDYSFSRVAGAEKYKLSLYNQADYDVATNTIAEGAEEVYSATIKQKDTATISGTISYIAEGAWGKYVAVLEAINGSEKAISTFAYVHGGKLNTPEFYVWQGTSGGGFGGGGQGSGGNDAEPDGNQEGGNDAPATQADDAPEGGNAGGEGQGSNSGGNDAGDSSDSSSTFVMQITINTDSYLTTQYETQAVYSFAYIIKDANGNVVGSCDLFADNIEPAGFTLYTNNVAEVTSLMINGKDTPLNELFGQTFYITVKANGCADDNVEDSDWSSPFELTLKEGSTIPFDAGFGRPSNIGGGGNADETPAA